jgi:hypothetical protein
MRAHSTIRALAVVLTLLPWGAHASENPANQRPVDFIGIFHPGVPGFSFDRARCPEPSHPLLLTFRGEAYTTVGHARFEQSHCEDFEHTSFRRGVQTIKFDNGDELLGAYSGALLPTPTTATDGRLIIDGMYRNTGGTGRFKHADGHGISIGTVDTMTGLAVVSVSGTL